MIGVNSDTEESHHAFARQHKLSFPLIEGCFATAIVATFFASTQSFQLSVAGHPRPLLYRRQTGTWELFEVSPDAAVLSRLR